jgi:hypothetical protein
LEDPVRRDGRFWSRTQGVLGADAWGDLCGLRVVVVGAGRLGSSLASELARVGVTRLSLIDPDVVEPHNLGEAPALVPLHVGVAKVEALAAELEARNRLPLPPVVRTSRDSIGSFRALGLVADADLLISAVDDPEARAATALLGSALLIPHLDVAASIVRQGGRQVATADVRFTNPGQACLACIGGLPGSQEIAHRLDGGEPRRIAWDEQRVGSLRSLNLVATALAMRQIEDRVRFPRMPSVWLQYQDHPTAPTVLTTGQADPDGSCPVCSAAGSGRPDPTLLDGMLRSERWT